MEELTHLATIASPIKMVRRRARPVIGHHQARIMLPQVSGIPKMPGRYTRNPHGVLHRDILRGSSHPGEEWPPDVLRMLLVEPLEDHRDPQEVPRPKGHLLPPVRIEEALVVQADDASDQGAEGRLRGSSDRPKHRGWCKYG